MREHECCRRARANATARQPGAFLQYYAMHSCVADLLRKHPDVEVVVRLRPDMVYHDISFMASIIHGANTVLLYQGRGCRAQAAGFGDQVLIARRPYALMLFDLFLNATLRERCIASSLTKPELAVRRERDVSRIRQYMPGWPILEMPAYILRAWRATDSRSFQPFNRSMAGSTKHYLCRGI